MFLRLIQKWPLLGMLLALSIEAWIPTPGEALIAAAAARSLRRLMGLLQVMLAAVAGMMINDLALFAISRMARGVALHFIHHHLLHIHLTVAELVLFKFLPPVRSTAFVLYGFQGTPLTGFVWASLISSVVWAAAYGVLGVRFRAPVARLLGWATGRQGRWIAAAEAILTVVTVVLILQPFS